MSRYERNEGLFGAAGQCAISEAVVALIGYGGLGAFVGLELAYLGVRRFRIAEFDVVEERNLNRLVGALPSDVGEPKLLVADRLLRGIHPDADLRVEPRPFDTDEVRSLVRDADVIFGCVDDDLTRLQILSWASENGVPYIDAATDTGEFEGGDAWYGGRVVVNRGDGCLLCLDEVDQDALRTATLTPDQLAARGRIYGVETRALAESGPSVVSLNGVVASLSVTEFMAMVTGLRTPVRGLIYHAHRGDVVRISTSPNPDCIYCTNFSARQAPRP
jgi:molybdopterin/thiamine biosynthesis adenylyltransferase